MKLLSLISALLLCLTCYNSLTAQSIHQEPQQKSLKQKPSKALKFYMDIKADKRDRNINFPAIIGMNQIEINEKGLGVSPSVGYAYFNKKGHYREFSVSFMGLRWRENSQLNYFRDTANSILIFPSANSQKETMLHLGVRWEYAFPIWEGKKGHFYLGASIEPTIYFQNIQPLSTAYFPQKTLELKSILAASPRYIWDISKNIYMDFNIPISLISFNYTYRHWSNPILPTYVRQQGNWAAQFLKDNLQARVGVGVKI